MQRKSPSTAWKLSGPEFHASTSLAAWRRGNTPVPFYPASEKRFHDWTTVDVGKDYVTFNLILHPAPGAKYDTYEFSGQVVRHGGSWLVNRFYTIATFGRHEVGPADFAAQGGGGTPPPPEKPHGARAALLPIVAIVPLVLLVPLILGIVAFFRARRFRRASAADPRNALPPLPRPDRERETAGRR